MNSKTISGTAPSGKRVILGEVLPLSTPFLVQIFPVYNCNFRCSYCLYALPRDSHGYVSDEKYMNMNLYKKCIDDMSAFQNKIKMLRFAGIGEPLLHKDIVEMIQYAKMKNIAESIDLVTNGVLLNSQLSKSLIDSGLDKLRISIQGVSSEKYQTISKVNLDFERLLENIKFFYQNKRETTKVYIKIIDCALTDDTEKDKFFNLFGDICDFIAIEHLTPTVKGIDYSMISDKNQMAFTQTGNPILDSKICPQPFYMMQINPDGSIVPCCSMSYPRVFAKVSEQPIESIWNGQSFTRFRRLLLKGVQNAGRICAECSLYKYGLFSEDILDDYQEQLKGLYDNLCLQEELNI